MPHLHVTHRHLFGPRQNLERWVKQQASLAQAEHGFTYRPSEHAPSTYSALVAAYRTSANTRQPYPVSFTNCDDAIFTPETNWALRFVHDLEHAKHQLNFTTDDEVALGNVHLEALRVAGYAPDSPEYKLLHADTIGQTLCVDLLGRFPYRQRLFDFDCVDLGVDAAIELEASFTEPAA